MAHTCSRDDCNPSNTAGPKASCVKCNKQCFLQCYGIEKYSNDFVKITINDATVIFETSNINFVCANCDTKGVIVTSKPKPKPKTSTTQTPSTPSSKDQHKQLLTEIKVLLKVNGKKIDDVKEIVEEGRSNSTKSGKTIDEVKQIVQENHSVSKGIFNKMTRPALSSTTPRASPIRPQKTNDSDYPSFSEILKRRPATQHKTPLANKRKRDEIELVNMKTSETVARVKLPETKTGKKNQMIGKPIEPKPMYKKLANPMTKSIWVSGVHPETTTEEIGEYIVNNTSVTDKTKFKCTKLVKKDQDMSKMSFISFKIDVSPDDFDLLIDPEQWPSTVKIREFIKLSPPKTTFGRFLPGSPSQISPAAKTPRKDTEDSIIADQTEDTEPNEMSTEETNANTNFPLAK